MTRLPLPDDVATKLDRLSPSGDGWKARCPAHDDRNPSLGLWGTDSGGVRVHCHAGCDPADVLYALGRPWPRALPAGSGEDAWTPAGPAVATYLYTDKDGKVVHATTRTADKKFRQWRPDGSGGKVWNLKGVKTTIYRLPRVLDAIDAGQTVYVVEGEKDVHALEDVGVTATCNAMGAGKWRSHHAKHLAHAEVVVVADHDVPGIAHARDVAKSLDGLAASVRLVRAATGKDATDHLAAGYSVDDFVPLEDGPVDGSQLAADQLPTVDGEDLLDDVEQVLGQYVAFPSEAARVAVTLWAAHAHAVGCFDSTPRLALLSPEPGSGKTRCLEVLELLTPQPMLTLNASTAATFRTIQAEQPTLLFDEVDTIFTKRGKDDQNEDLRALLNAGHRKGATIPRCVGQQQEVVRFPVFAATALAGLGDLPGTLMTRSVIIRMRRRAPNETIEPFRERTARRHLEPLRDRLVAWAEQNTETLSTTYPELPEGVTDRPADVWEPLVAVADAAGGEWPDRARKACTELVGAAETEAVSLGVRLLTDLHVVFDGEDDLPTSTILDQLHALPESPWADLRGKPLDARGLAHRLGQYGVKSRDVRVGPRAENRVAKGYTAADLHDPWSRYVPPPTTEDPSGSPRKSATGATTQVSGLDLVADTCATTPAAATTDTPSDLPGSAGSAGSASAGGTNAGTVEQPALDTTPGDGLPDGWQRLGYTIACDLCGEDCDTAGPHHDIRHVECAQRAAERAKAEIDLDRLDDLTAAMLAADDGLPY